MKIAILGAGFTGLTAALRLSQKGHQVVVFEREATPGGLAVGFKEKNWKWSIEKGYHHWFTNDYSVLNLAKELNYKVLVKKPKTDVYLNKRVYPLDSAVSVLKFPLLNFLERIRLGLGALYLRLSENSSYFEKNRAIPWIRKVMGEKVTDLIWQPLLYGKFGKYYDQITLSWFWARIKKRTQELAYPEGGFKKFVDRIIEEIIRNGGEVRFNSTVESIQSLEKSCLVSVNGKKYQFDKIIVTLPSPIFTKISKGLPNRYTKEILSIPHLSAHVLMLMLKKPFMKSTYWLNILEKNFPFLVVVEHTNFMDHRDYNGKHLLYIGNYLPNDHPFLSKDAKDMLKIYHPYLELLAPDYKRNLIRSFLFKAPFAQPVVTPDYQNRIPKFQTPLKNIYIANMDMVYPWDRGTNYAVEMGETIANIILK